jgi:hypothetical protein
VLCVAGDSLADPVDAVDRAMAMRAETIAYVAQTRGIQAAQALFRSLGEHPAPDGGGHRMGMLRRKALGDITRSGHTDAA